MVPREASHEHRHPTPPLVSGLYTASPRAIEPSSWRPGALAGHCCKLPWRYAKSLKWCTCDGCASMATAKECTAASPHCQKRRIQHRRRRKMDLGVTTQLVRHRSLLSSRGTRTAPGTAGHGKSPDPQSQSCSSSDTDSTHRLAHHGAVTTRRCPPIDARDTAASWPT